MVEVSQGIRVGSLLAFLATMLAIPFGPSGPAWAEEKAPQPLLPPPVEIGGNELVTIDGVRLAATFYPGSRGKDTVPIVLLHMSKGDRKEFVELAPYFQEQGHAVLVPDLRGHGDSTQMRSGSMRKLDSTRVSAGQYYAMAHQDMEALRQFLIEKNDAGKLNLNKLCVVGAEMGASVAVYYAQYDWTTPRREAERVGPARDVKALVLISPAWAFPGLPLNKPLSNPLVRSRLSMMILVGREDSKARSDAERIHNLVKRFHPDPKEVGPERQDLFFFPLPTKLQGTKMLGVKTLNLERAIGSFIDVRLVKQSYPWEQRGTTK